MSAAFVLVPLDGSSFSATALPAARRVAGALDAEVGILHVAEAPVPEDLRGRLGITPAELAGAIVIGAAGTPESEICRVAVERHASLIVMSSQGERAAHERSLGSTTAAVIQASDCPVLAVRPDMAAPRRSLDVISRILLPLDGSPGAAGAVGPAVELARRIGARLDLLHVATAGAALPAARGTMLGPRYLDAPQYEWPAWSNEFLRRFGPTAHELPEADVRMHHASGDPADEVLRHAREQASDLVAVAWHQTLARGHARVSGTALLSFKRNQRGLCLQHLNSPLHRVASQEELAIHGLRVAAQLEDQYISLDPPTFDPLLGRHPRGWCRGCFGAGKRNTTLL